MAKITSSSNRSKRSTKKPVTKGQNPQRANRQAVSQAKVTRGGRPQGARSYSTRMRPLVTSDATRRTDGKGAARVTTGMGQTRQTAVKNAATTASTLLGIGKGGIKAAVFKEGITARNTADATLKGKPTGNPQGPSVPKRLTKAGVDKSSFDKAFKAARSGGAKTFTWRGKKYNTKLKGEK